MWLEPVVKDLIPSTNSYIKENVLPCGSVVIAKRQTNGRGRRGNSWVSDVEGNIYMSVVYKPDVSPDKIPLMSIAAGLAVKNTLEFFGISCGLKWPNDVVVGGKKICGILCEGSLKKNILQGIVLGIGINLNMPKEIIDAIDRPAISLNSILNSKIDKQVFLNKLLDEFFKNYQKAIDEGFSFFKEDYLNRTHFLGKTVWIQQRDGAPKEEVIALRIDDNGNLIVKTSENIEKIIYSGDVLLSNN